MFRVYLFGMLLALMGGMLLQGFTTFRSSVAQAYEHGHAAGVAEISLKLNRQWDLERNASAALVADAGRQITSLEQQRSALEAKYASLSSAVLLPSAARRNCLAPRILRLLNDIGSGSAAPGGSP